MLAAASSTDAARNDTSPLDAEQAASAAPSPNKPTTVRITPHPTIPEKNKDRAFGKRRIEQNGLKARVTPRSPTRAPHMHDSGFAPPSGIQRRVTPRVHPDLKHNLKPSFLQIIRKMAETEAAKPFRHA